MRVCWQLNSAAENQLSRCVTFTKRVCENREGVMMAAVLIIVMAWLADESVSVQILRVS